jgi:hypothetical protein
VLDQLDAGDVLLVTRLDRLARSTRDLLNILATIAEKKAGFRSLGDTWADTTTSHGRLMLTVLGGLAEFERDLIRARTSEGRARAVANGVRLGRKPTLTPHRRREAIKRVNAGKETLGEIARSYAPARAPGCGSPARRQGSRQCAARAHECACGSVSGRGLQQPEGMATSAAAGWTCLGVCQLRHRIA